MSNTDDDAFDEIRRLEEQIFMCAVSLLDHYGSMGVLALEHTLKRIHEYRAPIYKPEPHHPYTIGNKAS